jgi:hypothetical protein
MTVLAQGALAPDDRTRSRRGWQPVQAGPESGVALRSDPKPSSRQKRAAPTLPNVFSAPTESHIPEHEIASPVPVQRVHL